MRQNGLKALRTQAWKRTTFQDPQAKTAHIENHMLDATGKGDFTSTAPGTRLVEDITYLRTGEGWLYLATVIDLFGHGDWLGHGRRHACQPLHRGPCRWLGSTGTSTDTLWSFTPTAAPRTDSTGRRNTSISEVAMGRPAGWMKVATGRTVMKSPGKPSLRRDTERAFWREIATGCTSERAAILAGVSQAAIAQELNRSPSTISRELRRNAATRAGKLDYRASVAQWKAERFAQRPKTAKLVTDERLHQYVKDKLASVVLAPDGRIVAGPGVPEWKGRNKPHWGDRECG